MNEQHIEQALIAKLDELKYTYRPDIRDRAALEQNFGEKFQMLNHVKLTANEFSRLIEQIIISHESRFIPPIPSDMHQDPLPGLRVLGGALAVMVEL